MDREKVIKGLEMCSTALKNLDPSVNCHECPYKEKDMKDPYETNCDDVLKMDALALLKEQEAVVRCKDCKHGEKCNAVYLCGKSRGFGIAHEPEWFCADGERRTE